MSILLSAVILLWAFTLTYTWLGDTEIAKGLIQYSLGYSIASIVAMLVIGFGG